MIPRFSAGACLEAMQRHRVTNVTLVPTMVTSLVNDPDVTKFDLSSLRQIQFGASPMPDATLERAVALWPDILWLHGWGMTEISPIGTACRGNCAFRNRRLAPALVRSCCAQLRGQDRR